MDPDTDDELSGENVDTDVKLDMSSDESDVMHPNSVVEEALGANAMTSEADAADCDGELQQCADSMEVDVDSECEMWSDLDTSMAAEGSSAATTPRDTPPVSPTPLVPGGRPPSPRAAAVPPAPPRVERNMNELFYDERCQPTRVFNGIHNHGSTCYLNSVLQALFFTIPFRDTVWSWDPNELENNSVAMAIQKVFIHLKMSEEAIETMHFFDSTHWRMRDMFRQMDVQEFKTELFLQLEKSLKDTDAFKPIVDLFEGVFVDYIKCLGCNKIKSHEEKFHDISLPVRAIDTNLTFRNIEEALDAFITPELLQGSEQYWCDNCNCKRDAIKGLAFKTVPKIFTIMLKRFAFNPDTMRRAKINDRVEFPLELDVTSLLAAADLGKLTVELQNSVPQRKDDSAEGVDAATGPSEKASAAVDGETTSKANGENLYELYAVLIHDGTIVGGHYYAYIKSAESNEWYKFDDQLVHTWADQYVSQAFGGVKDSKNEDIGNAYMLIYRKKEEKAYSVESSVLPAHITAYLENEAALKKIVVYYTTVSYSKIHDVNEHQNVKWVTYSRGGEMTVGDALTYCVKKFKLDSPCELYRMVAFDPETGIVTRELDDPTEVIKAGDEDMNIWLQVRSPDETFSKCCKDIINPYVILLDSDTGEIENLMEVPLDVTKSIGDFLTNVGINLSLADMSNLQLAMQIQGKPPQLLSLQCEQMLQVLDRSAVVRFFLFPGPVNADTFEHSKLYYSITALMSTTHIYAVLPPLRENVLKKQSGDIDDDDDDRIFTCVDETLNSKDGNRRVLLTVDCDGTLKWLRQKLADLLNINEDSETIILRTKKLINASEEHELVGMYSTLYKFMNTHNLYHPHFELCVYIQNELAISKSQVFLLDIQNKKSVFGNSVEVEIARQAEVGVVKSVAIKEMSKKHGIQLSYDVCRLRLIDHNAYVGKILHDKDKIRMYQECADIDSGFNLCLQPVREKEKLYSAKEESLFLFVQEYEADNEALGQIHEIFVSSGSSNEFSCKLQQLTQIPEPQLFVRLAMTKFPCTLGRTQYSTKAATWWPIGKISSWWDQRVYSDGQLIFYREVSVVEDVNSARTIGAEKRNQCERQQSDFLTEKRKAEESAVESMPAATEVVPAAEEVVPAAMQVVPAVAEVVPAAMQVVPEIEETVPAVADVVPASAKVVPATAEVAAMEPVGADGTNQH